MISITSGTQLIIILAIIYQIKANVDDGLCDVCECSIKKNLLSIDCSERQFKKVFLEWPESFSNYSTSEYDVLISYNSNDMIWLNKFPPTNNNVSLSIRSCGIQYVEYAPFREMKNLKFLDLGYNRITSENLRGDLFKGPSDTKQYEPIELQTLNLEYNLIHSLPKRLFEHTPKLTSLYLNGNPINTIDSVTILAISSLKNLELLDLSEIGISSIPNDTFRNSKKLYQLNLSDNLLKAVPEALGYAAESLKILRINNNTIEELNDNSFLGLTRLESLEVGESETLERIKSGTFIQLERLKVLHLCHNRNLKHISHEAFRELKDKWPIKELYLNNNNLRDLPDDLVDWKSLDSLNLNDNPWSCDCEFSKMIQKKEIIRLITKIELSPRCMSPIEQSGRKLNQLNSESICLQEKRDELQKRRAMKSSLIKRPKSIFTSLVFVLAVIIVGGVIGMAIARLRRKTKTTSVSGTVRYVNMNSRTAE